MGKKILKITTAEWLNANRDVRELTVARELGADVLVMAKGEQTGQKDSVRGFDVLRMSTRPLGNHIPLVMNRFVSVFTWAHAARKIKPDIISGHDLIPLYIGWLSGLFIKKSKKPKLVYDSHEFTIYAGNKSNFQRKIIKLLEGFLIKKCVFTIEVNNLIADEVQQIHRLKQRPVVVRNIPGRWEVDDNECLKRRSEMEKEFGKSNIFIMMYHGMLMPGRGIENLISTLELNTHLRLYIMGNGLDEYIEKLKVLAKEKSVLDKIIFHEAVSYNEIWKYAGAADVEMVLIQAACKSYFLSLPNKLFESIQAETPVICSNFPVMQTLVEKYNVGLTCDPENPQEINTSIEKFRLDKAFYEKCKENVKAAKKELCWEREQEILKAAYKNIL